MWDGTTMMSLEALAALCVLLDESCLSLASSWVILIQYNNNDNNNNKR